ncbi:hypothetical protein M2103_001806 [Ereboglobus sp. PH5-5]|uniref:DUF3300 domain-containing protein n=1 Tax=Ereboglobus sp. PH5-5 TaxID=2940529 RepID=UPI00240699F3|nr:DUF3300 domain-containing protein [Ereboglobus sp. PH5-5]MDF9833579.1 hypothetical protein [Ereboglobus sp. PH5-5]
MKTPKLLVVLCLLLACPLAADTAQVDVPKLTPAEVETLVGPIALYPDALIGVILPASTYATEIVLAARYFENGGTLEQVEKQFWDESVRSLAHYPEVLNWMNENLEWTRQLGVTFVVQPEDVMAAIQRLRARAHALGNLKSTSQLTVIKEPDYIRIIPTVAETIYIPRYDPDVIYVSRHYWGFGPAWSCGPWLRYDCNWLLGGIWVGAWSTSHFHRPAWIHHAGRPHPPRYVHQHTWRPKPGHGITHNKPPKHRPGHVARPRRVISDPHFNDSGRPPAGNRPSRHAGNYTERRPSSGKGAPSANKSDDRRRPSQPKAGASTRPSSKQRPAHATNNRGSSRTNLTATTTAPENTGNTRATRQRRPRNSDVTRQPAQQRQSRDVSRTRTNSRGNRDATSSRNSGTRQPQSQPPPRKVESSRSSSSSSSSSSKSTASTSGSSETKSSSSSSTTSSSSSRSDSNNSSSRSSGSSDRGSSRGSEARSSSSSSSRSSSYQHRSSSGSSQRGGPSSGSRSSSGSGSRGGRR